MRLSDVRWRRLIAGAALTACAGCGGPGEPPLPQPGSPEYDRYFAAFQMGVAGLEVDNREFAQKGLDRAIQLVPGEPAAWADRGLHELRVGDNDKAEQFLAKAAALAPQSGAIAELRGLVADRKGQLEPAIAHLSHAVELEPDNLKARLKLVRLLERRGGKDVELSVRQHLDHMHQVAPDNLPVQVERARVLSKTGDRAALDAQLAELDARKGDWPDDAKQELADMREAARAGKPLDVLFLQQVLQSYAPYQADLARIETPPQVLGTPIARTIRMTPPPARPAEPDAGLTFVAGPPGAKCTSAAPVWPDGPGKPAVRAVEAAGLAIGDLDHDFRADAVTADAKGLAVALQDDQGGWRDGPKFPGAFSGVWVADLDLDGDLDVVAAGSGPVAVLINDGAARLTEAKGHPFAQVVGARGFAWADLDGDGTGDAAFIDAEGRVRVFLNQRGGRFAEAATPPDLRAAAIAVGDIDADGRMDLVVLATRGIGPGGPRLARLTRAGTAWETAPLAAVPAAVSAPSKLLLADVDANGAVDVIVSGEGATQVLLAPGWKPVAGPAGVQALSVADVDGDGRPDLIGRGAGSALVVATAKGTRPYHHLTLRPRGAASATGDKRINTAGLGGEIEVRAGLLVQKQVIAAQAVTFGLGEQRAVDVARIVWPNGTMQAEFELTGDASVVAEQRLKGSCPWVFADGPRGVEFVTDFLWRSPLGLKINAVDTAGVAQTEDRVLIRGDQLVERDGAYDIRVTAELWETHYFDMVRLLVVDHPAGTSVAVDERFQPARPPSLEARVLEAWTPVAQARDDAGRDVTADVSARDGRYLDGFGRGEYQGVTREHWVEVELPPGQDWLVARGWIHPTDSSLNVAIGQGGRVKPHGIALDGLEGDGAWHTLIPDLGFPAGKNKTILVPVTGVHARRIRLRTNLEIYWDALAFARTARQAARTSVVALKRAQLRYRGFSRVSRASPSAPELPEYVVAGTLPRWRDLEGFHTPFGDVTPLLAQVDDRFAILNAGDELALSFAAAPPVAAGWRRDYVLVGDGWEKDGDFNTEDSRTVEPLPRHAATAGAPRARRERQAARFVSPRWFARGLWQETR